MKLQTPDDSPDTYDRMPSFTNPARSTVRQADPGNVRLSGLPRASVVNVSQMVTLDRSRLVDHVGRIGTPRLDSIIAGIELVLGSP